MVLDMKEIGLRINNMDTVKKYGLMVLCMKDNMSMEKSMEKAPLIGQTNQHMLVNFITIIFMGKEFIFGTMKENMKESGNSIKWMAMVSSHGLMEESILVIILKIRSMDRDSSFGLMADNIKENGQMENNMVKVYI